MPAIRERPTAAYVGQQLERRLAVAVLEILPPQLVAVGAQQDVPPLANDQGDLVDRVAQLSRAA